MLNTGLVMLHIKMPQRGAKGGGQLISNISLSSEYFSAKNNLHSLSEGNSYSLGPLPLRLSIAKGTIFLNWEHNLLASQYL